MNSRPPTRFEGILPATTRLRPARIAVLIDADDPNSFVAAVRSATMTWGGKQALLIPIKGPRGMRPFWWKVYRQFDPDRVVDRVGVSARQKELLQSFGAAYYDERLSPTAILPGTSIFSALSAWVAPDGQKRNNRLVVNPQLPDSDPRFLTCLAVCGQLTSRVAMPPRHRRSWVSGVTYEQFVGVSDGIMPEWDDLALQLVGGTLSPERTPTQPVSSYGAPIQETMVGTRWIGPSLGWGGRIDPEQPSEAYVSPVFVVGYPDSVEDLCLYWCLRALRPWSDPYPCWVPFGAVQVNTVKKIAERSHALAGQTKAYGVDEGRAHLLSIGLGTRQLATQWPDGDRVIARDLWPYFAQTSELLCFEEAQSGAISKGTIHVSYPTNGSVLRFGSDEAVSFDLAIRGVEYPRSRTLTQEFYGTVGTRAARSGELTICHWEVPRASLWSVKLPDAWTTVRSLFADIGLDASPSDKGRTAAGILRHLGTSSAVQLLRDSKVYDLIREMSVNKGADKERRYIAERRSFTYDNIQRKLDSGGESKLARLVDLSVLFRGLIVKCRECQLSQWQHLDALRPHWTCGGCRETQQIALPYRNAEWRYTVNSLYAHAFDQGSLLPVLVSNSLGAGMREPDLLFYPGVTLKPREVQKDQSVEIDLVAIVDRKPVLVECKERGSGLDHEQSERLVSMARQIGSREFIVATSGALSPDDASHLDSLADDIAIRIIDRKTLFQEQSNLNVAQLGQASR